MTNTIIGYQDLDSPIHRLNALAKLIYFLIVLVVVMLTYDTRLLLGIIILNLIALKVAKITWRSIRFFVYFVVFFGILNLVMIYVFSPEYGVELYGSRTLLWEGIGRYNLTLEQLFYEFNFLLKYFATLPLVLLLLITVNPSEFASSFNRIGIPYRVAYAISLTLRYIPDIQRDYLSIRDAQEARGSLGADKKVSIIDRIQQSVKVVLPLILTSFERIETISHAMLLRRFGQAPKRTWYVAKDLKGADLALIGLSLVFLGLYFYCLYVNQGRFYNPF